MLGLHDSNLSLQHLLHLITSSLLILLHRLLNSLGLTLDIHPRLNILHLGITELLLSIDFKLISLLLRKLDIFALRSVQKIEQRFIVHLIKIVLHLLVLEILLLDLDLLLDDILLRHLVCNLSWNDLLLGLLLIHLLVWNTLGKNLLLILHLILLNLVYLSLLLGCLLLVSRLLSLVLLRKVLLTSGHILLHKLLCLSIRGFWLLICTKLLNILDLHLLLRRNSLLNTLLFQFGFFFLLGSTPCILLLSSFFLVIFSYALLDILFKLAGHCQRKLGQFKCIVLLPVLLSVL